VGHDFGVVLVVSISKDPSPKDDTTFRAWNLRVIACEPEPGQAWVYRLAIKNRHPT
jgi:hypothetical protein